MWFPYDLDSRCNQFLVVLDGTGFSQIPKKAMHSGLAKVSGAPPNPLFEDVADYPDLSMVLRESHSDPAAFWGGSCLAVDEHIYQYLATANHPFVGPDGRMTPDFRIVGSKLIYSPDNGHTWHNQDGTSPVVSERWDKRSGENMVFFEEQPSGAFAWPSFLQMGRNYELNRDGYIYAYSPNGYDGGTMNELVMFGTPKPRVRDRRAYEFFDGVAVWTRDISARLAVHTFPRGWVNRTVLGTMPWAWVASVTYNAPLGIYMMASWGTGTNAEGLCLPSPVTLGSG